MNISSKLELSIMTIAPNKNASQVLWQSKPLPLGERIKRYCAYFSKIPEFLVKNEASANRGIGIKWSGTADKGRTDKGQNYIRIDKGNPNAEFPAQRVDHVRINSGGKVIGKDGKVVKKTDEFLKPSKNPESHIPLEEWLRWKEWDSL